MTTLATQLSVFLREHLDLSRIYAALIVYLGCLAFESQGAFASQR